MFNTNKPALEELPSPQKLLRSTVIAATAAMAILVTIVWPAEYAIDPTGIGRAIGLMEMGEIKAQLAQEAEDDRNAVVQPVMKPQSSLLPRVLDTIGGLLVTSAYAQEAPAAAVAEWKDSVEFALAPGQGTEIKLVMTKDAVASFEWVVDGGVVNFDLHGDGSGYEISYEKGRGAANASGDLTAAFDGNHGWYWRNRGSEPVNMVLRVRGDYSEIKRFD